MLKHIYLSVGVVFCTLLAGAGFSQSPVKFDRTLAQKQQAYLSGSVDGTEMLPVLVKGNVGEIKKLVESSGGVFKYSYNGIASIKIPVSVAACPSGFLTVTSTNPAVSAGTTTLRLPGERNVTDVPSVFPN